MLREDVRRLSDHTAVFAADVTLMSDPERVTISDHIVVFVFDISLPLFEMHKFIVVKDAEQESLALSLFAAAVRLPG